MIDFTILSLQKFHSALRINFLGNLKPGYAQNSGAKSDQSFRETDRFKIKDPS